MKLWKACEVWPPVKEGEPDGESHEDQELESSQIDEESAAPSEEISPEKWTDLGEYKFMPTSSIEIGRHFRKEMGDLTITP